MKKFTKIVALLLVLCMILTGCSGSDSTEGDGNSGDDTTTTTAALTYAEGTTLRIAAGYQKTNEAISFQDAEVTGDGITLADGNTYYTGDLKPTWQYLSEILGITFEDKFTGAGSASKEFAIWENQLDAVDIVAGSASDLNAAGAEGKLVNLADYLDVMPNFAAYLAENPIVYLSLIGDTETGAIYYSPYFDGVDDIERYPLIRADLVRELLDGDTAYSGANRELADASYEPYMPTSGTVTVESLTSDGTATQEITKDYDAYGNIIQVMNDALDAGTLTGDEAVQMLRDYIDATYGDTYENRSDLFLGYDACWDADELVALLRCAVASLNDTDGNPISGLYSRETSNLQREVDVIRFAGTLFGVRGLESRQEYLYFDSEGNLHDARQEEDTYEAIDRLNAMVSEGLIATTGSASSTNYLEKDAGLVSYDYNQTQTIMNDTVLDDGEEYIAIMIPVACWDDGTGETYMRFTESWRSVKTDGWAITVAGAGASDDTLAAALTLIDYAFSVQGQITMSYGPDDFIQVKDSSVTVETWDDVADKYYTFELNGVEYPLISDASYASLQELTNGNYTNYARRYLGSTLNGFPKLQAFEYQCTNDVGKEGAAIVSAAITLGTIKHVELEVCDNMWYTIVPTVMPTTAEQTNAIEGYTDLNDNFSTSNGGYSLLWDIVCNGTTTSPADSAANVANNWGGTQYLVIKQAQWTSLLTYYEANIEQFNNSLIVQN